LGKGTTSEYGLIIQKKVTDVSTDVERTSSDQQVEKIIYNEQMYILRDGRLYNATGAEVK